MHATLSLITVSKLRRGSALMCLSDRVSHLALTNVILVMCNSNCEGSAAHPTCLCPCTGLSYQYDTLFFNAAQSTLAANVHAVPLLPSFATVELYSSCTERTQRDLFCQTDSVWPIQYGSLDPLRMPSVNTHGVPMF